MLSDSIRVFVTGSVTVDIRAPEAGGDMKATANYSAVKVVSAFTSMAEILLEARVLESTVSSFVRTLVDSKARIELHARLSRR
jgi:hypothetical protein